MEESGSRFEIPEGGIDTPGGYLYYPPKQWKQVLFLIVSFFSAVLLGFVVSSIPGDLSELAAGVIYFVYILIFITGYSAWAGTVGALVFGSIKLPVLRAFYRFFVHKERPASIRDFLPTREEAARLLLRAQKFSRIFFILSFPAGAAGGFSTLFMSTSLSSNFFFILVMITSVLYGYFLYYFGRRGYLPLPEE